jgi:hypothetical protein
LNDGAQSAGRVMPLGNTALTWPGLAILVATVVAALLLMGRGDAAWPRRRGLKKPARNR